MYMISWVYPEPYCAILVKLSSTGFAGHSNILAVSGVLYSLQCSSLRIDSGTRQALATNYTVRITLYVHILSVLPTATSEIFAGKSEAAFCTRLGH
jgi:hypothetical protein